MENQKRKNSILLTHQSQCLYKLRSKTLYNIQDYLPDKQPIQSMISLKDKQQNNNINYTSLQSSILKVKTQHDQNVQIQAKYQQIKMNQLKNQIQKIKQEKDEFLHKLETQYKQKVKKQQQQCEQKIKRYQHQAQQKNKQIQQLTILVKQNKTNNQYLNQQLSRVQKSQKNLQQQIIKKQNQYLKKQQKKRNNLQFYLHKYQLNIQPKIKQTYTIQVQTQQQEKQFKKYTSQQLVTFQQSKPQTNWSTRKISQHSTKTNFYQMYQEKNQVSNHEQQFTSRSNHKYSATKPQRPRLVSHAQIYNEKENDRRRINQRIQGKKDYKNKIKQEQIQIYPIEEDKLSTIIEGILKWT